jgi:glycosyltransferase involved in cell wall biosynthesis
MKISLIHPSRGRAEKAFETYINWLQKAYNISNIEHIISIDFDDNEVNKYIVNYANSPKTNVVISNNNNLVEAANNGVKKCTGDLIILISDDFDCLENWDLLLLDAIKDKQDFVLKTFDGIQKWIVTLPIMDRVYYEKQGYIYHPEYQHMFCDTDMTHKASLEGKLIIRNDLVFTHNHYSIGKSEKDCINTKADLTFQQGEKVYLERVKNNFGLKKEKIKHFELPLEMQSWINSKI